VNKWFFATEPPTLDIHVAGAPLNTPVTMVYSNLFLAEPGYLGKRPDLRNFLPDLAASWEVSPDHLQITFKIRQGVRFHNKPPVNGRAMEPDDILFSWERFVKQGRIRTTIANAANPNAPVLSWTMPDPRTVVMKVKEPTTDLFASFSAPHAGLPSIIPRETDSSFDIRHDMIGTGPWVMSEYTPSVRMNFARNPNYYQDRPFIDRIEAPYILEYAQQIAQFKAGNIYDLGADIRQEDVLPTKRDHPELKMYATEFGGIAPGDTIGFGWPPTDANKPFKDERIRQALSMSFDRETFIDAFYNVTRYRAEGLPVKTEWNSVMGPGAGPWLLDPRTKEFGPNAKYYEHNVAEGKRLLAAAGYPSGVDVISNWAATGRGGPDYAREIQVQESMAMEVGFRPTTRLIDYQTEYGPKFRDGRGKFDGWAFIGSSPPGNDAVTFFHWRFHSTGQTFLGYDVNGRGDGSGDPHVDSEILKAQREFDTDKRMAIIHDLQRYLAKVAYTVAQPGFANGFALAWPVLQNYRVFVEDKRGVNYNWWIDDSQPPLRKA
jgi:peptide/nickel transport system substrate-binding protein